MSFISEVWLEQLCNKNDLLVSSEVTIIIVTIMLLHRSGHVKVNTALLIKICMYHYKHSWNLSNAEVLSTCATTWFASIFLPLLKLGERKLDPTIVRVAHFHIQLFLSDKKVCLSSVLLLCLHTSSYRFTHSPRPSWCIFAETLLPSLSYDANYHRF